MTITATTTTTPRATPRATTTTQTTTQTTATAQPTVQRQLQRLLIYSIAVGIFALIWWIILIQFAIEDQRTDGFIFYFFTIYSFIISYLTVIISNIYIFYLTTTAIKKEQQLGDGNNNNNDNNNYNNNNNNNYNNNNNNNSNNNNNNNYSNNNDRCPLQSICTSWCVVGSHLFVTLNSFAGIIVTIFSNYTIDPFSIVLTILWHLRNKRSYGTCTFWGRSIYALNAGKNALLEQRIRIGRHSIVSRYTVALVSILEYT